MNKRKKASAGTVRQAKGTTRVVRVSEEVWAAKTVEASQRGKPMELAACLDRALRLYSKAA